MDVIKCRVCCSFPVVSVHSVCLGHGDFMNECVYRCPSCHVDIGADDRTCGDDFKVIALSRWNDFMSR